ncbi:hypothetical protein WJX82_004628 [Trebouxia sp. C0006]
MKMLYGMAGLTLAFAATSIMSATDGRLICDSDAVAANSSYTLATGKINEHQRCAQDVGVAWGSILAYMMVAALIVIGQKYCEEARTLWDKVVLFDVHKFEFNFLNVMLFRTSLP